MTTTDAERIAFIAAIVSAPAEDTPRLVFADWLQERGEEARAEFIRTNHSPLEFMSAYYGWGFIGGEATPSPRLANCFGLLSETGFDRFSNGTRCVIHRGFVSEVACTAADWLQHADQIAWHPGQTVACPECDGWRYVCECDPESCETCFCSDYPCDGCEGTGRVPRPCPPTAQPVVSVRLTTWPGEPYTFTANQSPTPLWVLREEWTGDRGVVYTMPERDAAVRRELANRWPGVTFHLPDA
jgi:uncharacterized protein (TIGR02996 family)